MSGPPQLIDSSFVETAKGTHRLPGTLRHDLTHLLTGYLLIMYPQFGRDQIEIAVGQEATSSMAIRFRYYVCVWVHTKEPDVNGRNLKLLELGPECQSVEEAFRSYVDVRLIPEVSKKTREHAAKTRMTRWRVPGANPQASHACT